MKKIKILGTGCQKCRQTENVVREVVAKNNIVVEIEKVDDVMSILEYDIIATPAIAIDDQIVMEGKIPSAEEMTDILTYELSN